MVVDCGSPSAMYERLPSVRVSYTMALWLAGSRVQPVSKLSILKFARRGGGVGGWFPRFVGWRTDGWSDGIDLYRPLASSQLNDTVHEPYQTLLPQELHTVLHVTETDQEAFAHSLSVLPCVQSQLPNGTRPIHSSEDGMTDSFDEVTVMTVNCQKATMALLKTDRVGVCANRTAVGLAFEPAITE